MKFYLKLIFRLASDIFFWKEVKGDYLSLPKFSHKRIEHIKRFFCQLSELKNIKNLCGKFAYLSKTYKLLADDYSKKIFIELLSGYVLYFRNVILSRNNETYWLMNKKIKTLVVSDEKIYFKNYALDLYNLKNIGFSLKLFNMDSNIMGIFLAEQYRYNHSTKVEVQKGDFVIDAGGGWGESALYFAHTMKNSGSIFLFEFIPSFLNVIEKNLEMNPELKDMIQIVRKPLWNISEKELFIIENGRASKVSTKPLNKSSKSIKTISLDVFVKQNKILKIDFIKMDVEGAEPNILIGSKEIIKKFRPKLAISIYHDLNHFFQIPLYLNSLNLNYKFYLDHFTTQGTETILFSKTEKNID